MTAFAYIVFAIGIAGPVVAYGIYTGLRGEPRRADKPSKSARKVTTTTGGASS